MQREGCHWQTGKQHSGDAKRIVRQRGIRQIQPEQNGCMAVVRGLGGSALLTAQELYAPSPV